eukprot:114543_1
MMQTFGFLLLILKVAISSGNVTTEGACLEDICWNTINEELEIANFSANSIDLLELLNENLITGFDEYALGLIIYNWWYKASIFNKYLGIASIQALKQNESLIYSLSKHNYDEESGNLRNPKWKHSILLRQSLNAVLKEINLPLIEFEDVELHYLSPRVREMFLIPQSFELRRGIFNMFGGRNIDIIDITDVNTYDMSIFIGGLIYIELQATELEKWLWRALTEPKIVQNKFSSHTLQSKINPYFEEHLFVKEDNIEPSLGAEETHALHAFIMAKQMCLKDENNCNTIKKAFSLQRSLELNVFHGIYDSIKRQKKK